jgi:hypothetical protein
MSTKVPKVWPDGTSYTLPTGAYRSARTTVALINRVLERGPEIGKAETLRTHSGAAGYTLRRGQ